MPETGIRFQNKTALTTATALLALKQVGGVFTDGPISIENLAMLLMSIPPLNELVGQGNEAGITVPNPDAIDAAVQALRAPLFGEKRNVFRRKGVRKLIAGVAKTDFCDNTTSGYNFLSDVATTDTWYGGANTVRLTTVPLQEARLYPAAAHAPIDMRDGMLVLTYKPQSNVGTTTGVGLDRLSIDIFDQGSPAAPHTEWHQFPSISPDVFKAQATNAVGEGRPQRFMCPVNSMVANTGAGAGDLSAIIYARVFARSAAGQVTVLDDISLEFVPNALEKPVAIITFDDYKAIPYATSVMAKYGFPAMTYGGAKVTNVRTTNPDNLNPNQIRALHDLGWQMASQAGTSEDVSGFDNLEFLADLAKSIALDRALGVTGWEDSSYFTAINHRSLAVFEIFRMLFRTMRTHLGGNGSGPPLPFGEMFPFGDPYFVRALNAESYTGSDAGDRIIDHFEQTIANKGLGIVNYHNLTEPSGNIKTGYTTAMGWLNDNRDLIEVRTLQDLYRQYG